MKRRIGYALLVMLLWIISVVQASAAEITPAAFQKEEQEEPSRPIFIRRMHAKLETCTYKDGEMVTSDPREEVITYYIVGWEDETISSVAELLHITEEALRAENVTYDERESDEIFQRNTHVRLPKINWGKLDNAVYYQIEEGDYLLHIANFFQTSCWNIQQLNEQIEDSNLIYAKDWIQVR